MASYTTTVKGFHVQCAADFTAVHRHYFVLSTLVLLHCTVRPASSLTCLLAAAVLALYRYRSLVLTSNIFIFMVKTSQFTTKCKIDC